MSKGYTVGKIKDMMRKKSGVDGPIDPRVARMKGSRRMSEAPSDTGLRSENRREKSALPSGKSGIGAMDPGTAGRLASRLMSGGPRTSPSGPAGASGLTPRRPPPPAPMMTDSQRQALTSLKANSPVMRGGGLARKGVGQALANGGLVKSNGCAKRGKTRGKMM